MRSCLQAAGKASEYKWLGDSHFGGGSSISLYNLICTVKPGFKRLEEQKHRQVWTQKIPSVSLEFTSETLPHADELQPAILQDTFKTSCHWPWGVKRDNFISEELPVWNKPSSIWKQFNLCKIREGNLSKLQKAPSQDTSQNSTPTFSLETQLQ